MQSVNSSSPLQSLDTTPSVSASGSESNPEPARKRQNQPEPSAHQLPKRQRRGRPGKSSSEKLQGVFQLLHTYKWSLKTLLQELHHASQTSASWTTINTNFKKFVYQDPDYLETNMDLEDWKKMLEAVKWHPVKALLRKEIKALATSDCYGTYNNTTDITDIDSNLLLPIEPARLHAPVFLELLSEITRPLRPSTRDEPVSRFCFMLYLMCYTQQTVNCNRFATLLGIYLHNAGLRKRAQVVLAALGVCSGYKHTNNALTELTDEGINEVRRIGSSPTVVTTYDNWEMAERVNEVRFGDNQSFLSATTGLINRGSDMPENGLERHMYNPKLAIHTDDIISTGLAASGIQKNIWRFYIFESIRAAFPDVVNRIYKSNRSLKPARPVVDQIAIPNPIHQPLIPSMLNESTNANNLQIIDEFFSHQMRISPDDPRFDNLYFLMIGDQKTVAQWRSIKTCRYDARRPYERLQWLLPVFGLWHFKFNFLQLLHSFHWLATSHDDSTLWTAAKHWDRRNLSAGKDFKSLEQLVIHSFQSRIIGLLISDIRQGQRASSMPMLRDSDVLTYMQSLTSSTLDSFVDKIYEKIQKGQKPFFDGDIGTEWQNHMTYLHHAMPYLVLKDSVKYGDIGLLRYVMNTCCVLFQGAASHCKYARELFYFVHLTSTNAASPELQRAVLSNSLVNFRGQRDSYEKDRRLEHHNGYLKELKLHHRTSSLAPAKLLKRYSLLVPSFHALSGAVETTYKAKCLSHHALKSVHEELLSLALLLCKTSLHQQPGPVSKTPVRNLYYLGLRNIETRIQEFNNLIQDDEDNDVLHLEDQEIQDQVIESSETQPQLQYLNLNDSDSEISVVSTSSAN